MPFSIYKTKRHRLLFLLYWIFLAYIISALVWWFIALNSQNRLMAKFKTEQLQKGSPQYDSELQRITESQNRKTAQYIGEGSIFFLLIMAGAAFIFRAVRQQFNSAIQQQNFMMAVTHELKTPIAVAKLNLETLLKRKLDENQQHKLLQNTIQEANRLNALCNNMLLTSQIDGSGYAVTKEDINLSGLVNECADDFIMRYPARKIILFITQNIFIRADKILLQMAFNNLIDNAIKYTSKEAAITLLLHREKNTAVFSIKDEGAGIAHEEKKKIFEKFYRVGNAATKGARGTGLGLYLTKKIVAQHNADIVVTDNTPTGSIFTISFKTEQNGNN